MDLARWRGGTASAGSLAEKEVVMLYPKLLSTLACVLTLGASVACKNATSRRSVASAHAVPGTLSSNKAGTNQVKPRAAGTKAPLKLQHVAGAIDKEAVCNDGSPATFYARAGTPEDSDKWIIHLQGGGSCSSKEECAARPRRLKSSRRARSTRVVGGVLDADPATNPDFHGYNHVFVPYCSSDSWMGDSGASDNALNMHWRGKKIVATVIEQLGQRGLADANELVFTGCSAGAAGMRHNLDDVAAMLPRVRVVGVGDAAYAPQMPSLSRASVAAWGQGRQRRVELWDPRPDASCAAAVGRGNCLSAIDVAENYITTPLFVRMAQRDHKPLERFNLKPRDPGARVFGSAVREAMERRDSGFSPDSSKHCTITGSDFNREKIDGVSFRETVGNWVRARPGAVKMIER